MERGNAEAAIDTWLRKHRLLYVGATRHRFILDIRGGVVDLPSFKRWLAQDYIFVRAFVAFLASVLVKAWKESDVDSDVDVILGGIAALNDEIAWFKNQASKYSIALSSVIPHQKTLDYCRFLESLMRSEVGYTEAMTACWAIETVYQESFRYCLEEGNRVPEELQEACQRWGNEEFGHYSEALKQIANRRLEKESDVVDEAEVIFLGILEHEIEFWNMSYGAV